MSFGARLLADGITPTLRALKAEGLSLPEWLLTETDEEKMVTVGQSDTETFQLHNFDDLHNRVVHRINKSRSVRSILMLPDQYVNLRRRLEELDTREASMLSEFEHLRYQLEQPNTREEATKTISRVYSRLLDNYQDLIAMQSRIMERLEKLWGEKMKALDLLPAFRISDEHTSEGSTRAIGRSH
ncbi:hypothetical protein SUGI_0077910 [Cryptomeria japonica]|nr:hypothetical protein SUGI_0077910 [Cryptomeria japonica]